MITIKTKAGMRTHNKKVQRCLNSPLTPSSIFRYINVQELKVYSFQNQDLTSIKSTAEPLPRLASAHDLRHLRDS